ncbi:MAG: glycosyltransferase family 4 protein [Anaerolineales bacterium]|nr:glycosyltransferase family 4 protein [Anaerolineales bacterium]
MNQTARHKVYFYIQDYLPLHDGSGPYIRAYSNVRAYLDLNFDVEIIHIQTRPQFPFSIDPTLPSARWTHLEFFPSKYGNPLDYVAYCLGRPLDLALNHYFKIRRFVRREIRHREVVTPGALHHFEYLRTLSAAINYPKLNAIGDFPDFESKFLREQARMRQEIGQSFGGLAGLKYMERAERMAVDQSRLILAIAKHENEMLRQEWGCTHAEFLPTSWADETPLQRTRAWGEGGILRLIHVGRIDSLASFRSLPFILQEVFPRLGEDVLSRLELIVIGEIPETKRSRVILEAAQPYPQVHFLGYQKDLRLFYAAADLQIVGSIAATGLRTRIIESFVYGVPVLSTIPGAEGVEGMIPGKNILLAENAEAFAQHLRDLVASPERLKDLAEGGQLTYRFHYSRSVVADKLATFLERHVFSRGPHN